MRIKLKPKPKRPYMPHQQAMEDYWVQTTNPKLVVEMRLGKTLVAVRGTIKKGCIKTVINAPINAMTAWEKELNLEGENFIRAYACETKKRIQAVSSAFDHDKRVWVLVNFEGYRWVPRISELTWDMAIADESVKLKNPKSQISQLFAEGFRTTKHRAILSGMIAPESELDIFQQFKFCDGRFMNKYSYWSFRSEYFKVDDLGYTWSPKDHRTSERIKEIVHQKSYVLRRSDAGMVKTKVYTTRTVQMNAIQAKLYKQIETDFYYELSGYLDYLEESGGDETVWATEKAIWAQRIAGGFTPDGEHCISTAKYDEILYLMNTDLRDQQCVIWFQFLSEIRYGLEYLRSKGLSSSAIWGQGMKVEERVKNEQTFNAGKSKALLVMEKLGAQAKDFSAASVCFYYSNEPSGDIRGQSEDRILHPLKDDPLLYIDLICSDTIDEDKIQSVQTKVFNARSFMTSFKKRRDGEKPLFIYHG